MTWFLAWRNLRQNRRRTCAAIAGLTFAILLVFLQLGLLAAVRRATTQLYASFAFDVMVVSLRYEDLHNLGEFDRVRLMQAAVVPGVAAVLPVYMAEVSWTNPQTLQAIPVQLVGVPVRPDFLRDPALRAALPHLAGGASVLVDRASRGAFKHVASGDIVLLNEQRLRIAGRYQQGVALQAEGGAFIDVDGWQRVTGQSGRNISLGLVQVRPGTDPVAVARDLRATLPGDVLVFTREEFIRGEQEYLVQVKPLGIVFRMGALVGCVAAAVMLFQVLATDVTFRLREYAMLTAMGFRARFVYGVGLCQAALYLGASAMAAAGLAAGIFLTVRKITTLPAWLDWPLAEATLGLVAALGALSTLLALQRLRRAAPAELFSA